MDRSVRVRLMADIGDYVAKMSVAGAKAGELAAKVEKSATKNKAAWAGVSTGLLGIGAAAVAGSALAVRSFANFDAQMSAVKATGSDAAGSINELRDAALNAGREFGQFTATDAAKGIEELAKAGVSASDTLSGALNGALSLAAAGMLGVDEAASITATTLAQFQLKGKDASHVADLLAAGAGKAVGDVGDMAAALKMGGTVAAQYGVSVEETVGVLALFSQNAINGSDAGTSLKTMLLQLASPTKESQAALDELGISAYDVNGNFVGMASLADQLKSKMSGLSQAQQNAALKTIFGADAIRTASVLMREGGDAVRQWTADVNDQGYAAEVAGTKMDNLKGDLAALSGAWETFTTKLGASGNGPLRESVQDLTAFIDLLGNMSPQAQKFLLGATVAVGGTALMVGGFMKVVTAAEAAKAAMVALSITAKGATLSMGAIGVALAIATSVFGAWATAQSDAKARTEDYTTALQGQTSAVNENTRAVAAKHLQDAGALTAATELGLALSVVTDAALGNADAMAEVKRATDAALASSSESFATSQYGASSLGKHAEAALTLSSALGDTNDAFNSAVTATNQMNEATAASTTTVKTAKEASDELVSSLEAQVQATRDSANAALAASGGMIGLEAAIDQATASVKANGRNLDINTEKGRANRQALDQIAAAGLNASDGLKEAGASSKTVADAQGRAYTKIVETARSMGMSKDAAEKLAKSYGLIPEKKETTVTAKGAKSAKTDVDNLSNSLNGLKDRTVYVKTIYSTDGAPRTNVKGVSVALAGGGPIAGPGTSTSDSILVAASNGEYMFREYAARRLAPYLDYMNRTGELPLRRASGGPIYTHPSTSRTYTAPSYASAPASVGLDPLSVASALRDGMSSMRLTIAIPGIAGAIDARITSVQQASDMAVRTGGTR